MSATKNTKRAVVDSNALLRMDLEQIVQSSKQWAEFEAMDNRQLADFASNHEMIGFAARHHLWNRVRNFVPSN